MNDVLDAPSRAQIEHLQRAMYALPQATIPTLNHFADGVYVREMHCLADTTIVGKVHKREHFFMLAAGEMSLTGDGLAPRRVVAPFICVSAPGVKRVGYAHTDCVVINIHRTDSKNLEEIERELIEPDDTALFNARNESLPWLG